MRGGITAGVEDGEVAGRQAERTAVNGGAPTEGEREDRVAGLVEESRRSRVRRDRAPDAVSTGSPREGGTVVGAEVGEGAGHQVWRPVANAGAIVRGEEEGRAWATPRRAGAVARGAVAP